MLKFEDRVIALQFDEIKELNEKITSLRDYNHKLIDELSAVRAQNRALKEQIADYELLIENEEKVSAALADALGTIEKLQAGEVLP